MALKLKGSTSGFVALDAPSVAGNNTLTLPENSGSAFQLFGNDITAGVTTFTQVTVSRNGDLTVPGTISIGGTLTYEDVTSVDSVGIVTARGLSIFGNTTGLQVASGISTFQATTATTGTFSSGVRIENTAYSAQAAGNELIIGTTTGDNGITIASGNSGTGNIFFGDDGSNSIGYMRYDHNSNFLKFNVNGSEKFRIDSSGRVIITNDSVTNPTGTNTQYAPLVVRGNTSATSSRAGWLNLARSEASANISSNEGIGEIYFGDQQAGEYGAIKCLADAAAAVDDYPGRLSFWTTANGASSLTERMRIKHNGHINIGAEVATDTGMFKVIAADGDSADLYVGQFENREATAGQSYGVNIRAGSNSTDHGFRVKNRANDQTQFLVRGDGKILMGGGSSYDVYENSSTSPRLQIKGTDLNGSCQAWIRATADAGGPKLFLSNTRSNSGQTVVQSGDELGQIHFAGSDGSQFVDGCQIRAAVDGTPGGDDMPGRLTFHTTADGSATCTERMRIDRDGKLLVGTTSSTASPSSGTGYDNVCTFNKSGITITQYSVVASIMYAGIHFTNSQYYVTNNSGTGVYLGNGNTSWTAHSDERLKINIAELDGTKAYNHVKTARASSFNWNVSGYSTDKKIGFIAQDWETNYPELVNSTTETIGGVENPKGIQYTETIPVLMAALKQAIAKIETLESEVAALKGS